MATLNYKELKSHSTNCIEIYTDTNVTKLKNSIFTYMYFVSFSSPKAARKKKASGSPRKAAPVDTKAGSGGSFKSKEFISSSDSSGGEGKPSKKKKAKLEKKKPVKEEKAESEDDSDDEDFEKGDSDSDEDEEKPKGRRTSKRGKPGGEIKEEEDEFAGVS